MKQKNETNKIDNDTERIIRELLRFRRGYRRKYVLMVIANFIKDHC